jgi:hypothetical protein
MPNICCRLTKVPAKTGVLLVVVVKAVAVLEQSKVPCNDNRDRTSRLKVVILFDNGDIVLCVIATLKMSRMFGTEQLTIQFKWERG